MTGLHCVKSVRVQSFSGPYFPKFGLNIQSECGNIRTRKTLDTDTFHAVLGSSTGKTYLSPYLKSLLCNAMIQPHFDYACSAWYLNLYKKLKSELQTIQIKYTRSCLQINRRSHIGVKEFEKLNRFPVSERFSRYFCSNAFNFFIGSCLLYLNINMIYINNQVKIKQIRSIRSRSILSFKAKATFKKHVLVKKLCPI